MTLSCMLNPEIIAAHDVVEACARAPETIISTRARHTRSEATTDPGDGDAGGGTQPRVVVMSGGKKAGTSRRHTRESDCQSQGIAELSIRTAKGRIRRVGTAHVGLATN